MPPLPLSTPERSTAKALLDTPSDQSNSLTDPLPKILILLASYNGGRWIRAQIKSILAQQGVEVQLLIRDDGSTDTTLTEAQKIAEGDARVMLIPPLRPRPIGIAKLPRLGRSNRGRWL